MGRLLDGRQRFAATALLWVMAKLAQRFKSVRSYDMVAAFLREKKVLPYEVFDRLADFERELAFSTALRFDAELLRALSDELDKALADAATAREFRERADRVMAGFGRRVSDYPAHRLDLIFVQETTRANNAGRYSQAFSPEGMEIAELWEFVARNETVLKDPNHSCSQMNGKLFWKDDRSAWSKLPQLHFCCQCILVSRQYRPGMKVEKGNAVIAFGDEGFTHDKLTPLKSIYGPGLGLSKRAA